MTRTLQIQIVIYMLIIASLVGRICFTRGFDKGKEIGYAIGFGRGKQARK